MHDSDVHTAAASRARLAIDRALAMQVGLWYFALLLPTLYFKRSALDAMYEEGIGAALDARGIVGLHRVGWWLLATQADIWQVVVAVLLLAAVGHALLRIGVPTLAALSVLAAMLISAANWLSFVMLGTLLDADNLRIAADWLRANPWDIAHQGNPSWWSVRWPSSPCCWRCGRWPPISSSASLHSSGVRPGWLAGRRRLPWSRC